MSELSSNFGSIKWCCFVRPSSYAYPGLNSIGSGADCCERSELQGSRRHPAGQGVLGGQAALPDGGKLEVGPLDAGQRVPRLGTSTSRRNFEEILLGQLLVGVDLVDVAG